MNYAQIIERLETRIAELRLANDRLAAENADLRSRVVEAPAEDEDPSVRTSTRWWPFGG